MSIADELVLLANTKENLRVSLGLSKDVPFSKYASYSMRWDPSALFSNAEQGAWYDPSDISTLFQDAAGTTPAADEGDPVGLMLDKSGNGKHAKQTISASRPIYRTDGEIHWLEFDGVDDHMVHDLSLNNASTVIAVAERTGGDGTEAQGLFTVTAANTLLKSNLLLKSPGSVNWGTFAGAWRSAGVNMLDRKGVLTLTASGGSILSNVQTLYTDGIFSGEFIGGFAGDYFPRTHIMAEQARRVAHGHFYGGLAVDSVLPASVRSRAEQYLAQKSGVLL